VLFKAFRRALRDPYPGSRKAGLYALLETKELYPMKVKATLVIPLASFSLVDGNVHVRKEAFKVVKAFLRDLEERIDEIPAQMEKEAEANSGMLSWAMNTVTKNVVDFLLLLFIVVSLVLWWE